ncbi:MULTISPECIES: sigma-70 family RNA polymerase sigma factor [Paenibacillus]|uniref:sigma-70 family RNA polymerase sigma factor n=1 Tax=Paenibacillus TaxID=44249 RepID=UPI002FDF1254
MPEDIEKAKQGNKEAFEPIVRHYTAMAKAVAYGKLKDRQLAEDAVQEAFTEAFLHLDRLTAAEAFPGWFKTIVLRQCYRILRRKRVRAVPYEEADEAVLRTDRVSEAVIQRELQQSVRDSLAALTAPMRLAVQLFYFQGYSLQEISAFTGTSVSALKKRLYDARKKLRGTLPVADPVSVYHQLYEGGRSVLHLVNGHVVEQKLRQGGVQGDILVWREIYTHGPVFARPEEAGSRDRRARYLEETLGIPGAEYIRISEAQEKVLEKVRNYEEVVLWFEHDLFDQTMLCYLLSRFSGQDLGRTKLSLLCIGEYPGIEGFRGLGQLTPEQLGAMSGTWTPVGTEQLELGAEFWEAYTSPGPVRLQELLDRDTSVLPFAKEAFRLHLERYPSVKNGLGIVEETTLQSIRDGVNRPLELFRLVGDRLSFFGMGDLQYWHILRSMSLEPCPLLKIRGVPAFPGYGSGQDAEALREGILEITEFGHQVLNGKEDAAARRGIDEWYGGVHLQGRMPEWRWDASRQRIQGPNP